MLYYNIEYVILIYHNIDIIYNINKTAPGGKRSCPVQLCSVMFSYVQYGQWFSQQLQGH